MGEIGGQYGTKKYIQQFLRHFKARIVIPTAIAKYWRIGKTVSQTEAGFVPVIGNFSPVLR